MDYTTPHTPQLNSVIRGRFTSIKEGALAMLLNAKLNYTAHKILWSDTVHTCKHVRKNMAITGSAASPFENFHGEKPKIVGSFLDLDVLDTSLNSTSSRLK